MPSISELMNLVQETDVKLMKKWNGIGGKFFTYFLKVLAFLGRETLWIFLILFYFFIWYDPFLFSYFFASFFSGVLIIAPLKEIIGRRRPFKVLEIQIYEREPTSKSFPSWHVYNVFIHGLLISTLVNNLIISILLFIVAVLVAFSRIQFGVHYFTDCVAGFLLGLLGFLFVQALFGPFMHNAVLLLEQFSVFAIEYQQINRMIFEQFWYLMLCVVIFGALFLSSTFKMIKEYLL